MGSDVGRLLALFAELGIDERWKTIRIKRRQAPVALYDLNNDLGESHNPSIAKPVLVARANARFES